MATKSKNIRVKDLFEKSEAFSIKQVKKTTMKMSLPQQHESDIDYPLLYGGGSGGLLSRRYVAE